MRRVFLALLSGFSLAGCSSLATDPYAQSAQYLQSIPVCCEHINEFKWSQLTENEKLNFEISEASSVGLFGRDKSYFSAFELSPKSGTVALILRSKMAEGHVIAPYVQFFDQKFQLQKEIAPQDFLIKHSDALTYNRFEIQLDIDAQNTPYFVIFTRDQSVGKKISVPHPARLRAQQSGEPMPMVTDPIYVSANTGQFELTVTTRTFSNRAVAKTSSDQAQSAIKVQPDTQSYYFNAIEQAVAANNLPKALSLLDEAKALGVEGAQEVFIKAVNSK
ncbi:maltose operon protein [Vibrio xiamenensis]|uniref:Maltose operon protein n=1 Tax=Vibrio xiamenensis TaxID=861298 RepID=A0A1G7XJ47_9VIBR|nr:MalM family protein [Vibrio xiamenensis]SDG84136.1 maltose operon protein [Vibrio xiamenensis]